MRPSHTLFVRITALLLAAGLSACAPSSQEAPAAADTPAASEAAPTGAGTAATAAVVASEGANALQLNVDGSDHAVRNASGSAMRLPVIDAEGVESLTLEVYNEANTLYAKADLFVAAAETSEGSYQLGSFGSEGVRNTPRRGQLTLAIEGADGRRMIASADGELRLRREGQALVADFEFSRSAFMGESPVQARGQLRISETGDIR